MENDSIFRISQANEETKAALGSHDFRMLLKKVNQAGNYIFKQFVTEYGETVIPSEYHQLCRYKIAPKEINDLNEFDDTLVQIKEWLKEVI